MTTKTVTVRLQAATAAYQAAMARASASTKELARNITGVGDTSDKHLQRISRGALLAAGGLTLGLGLSAKAAISWESAWAGVTKTVNGSTAELASLETGLRGLTKELPATHAEIAGVAEVAGQLGVSTGGVEKFTNVMIDLGETTNLTAEQAATGLARISNIMGTSERDVERMGSTIVELGNNSATTEAEIVELSTRLAAAGRIAGLSESDVFAFASTLTSVGVEAEAGGTALSKVFTGIRDAVIDGGDDLETFARVAGVSVDQFSTKFRNDAAGAVAMFIAGLGRMNETGQSTSAVFDELGMADQRLMRALLSTATAGDLLTESIAMAGQAWEDNTALQTEAEKRYATTSAQLEIARNKVVDFGIDMGSTLLPALNSALNLFGTFADGLAAMPGPLKSASVGVGGLTTALLGTVGILGVLGPKVREAKRALEGMGGVGKSLAGNLGKIAGVAAVAGAAIGAGVMIYEAATRASREYDESVRKLTQTFGDVSKGQLDFNDAVESIQADKFEELGAEAKTALSILNLGMADFQAAVKTSGDALDPLREKFADAASEIEYMGGTLADIDLGKFDDIGGTEFAVALDQLAESAGLTSGELTSLIEELEDYDNAQQESARKTVLGRMKNDDYTDSQKAQVAAFLALHGEGGNWLALLEQLAPKTDTATKETQAFTSAAEAEADAIESVEDAIESMMDMFNALIGIHVGAQEAVLDTIEGFDTLTEAFKENGATLKENTAEGRANQRAIMDQISVIGAEIEARRKEGDSVDEVTAAALGHVAALKETMRQAGFTEAEIRDYIHQLGLTPENIETTVKMSGHVEAEQILADLTRNRHVIVSAVARLSGDPRAQAILRGQRWGGIHQFAAGSLTSYAGGGIHAHVGRGDLIRYAEPETGGEAFIPRRGDPGRSMSILQEAAGWYGATVVDKDWGSWTGSQLAHQSSGGGETAALTSRLDRLTDAIAQAGTRGLVIENATFGDTGAVRDLDFFTRSKLSGV